MKFQDNYVYYCVLERLGKTAVAYFMVLHLHLAERARETQTFPVRIPVVSVEIRNIILVVEVPLPLELKCWLKTDETEVPFCNGCS
jgi:hypothetical protein